MGLIKRLLLVSLSLLSAVNAAEILSLGNSEDVIADSYIVVMKDGLSQTAFDTHKTEVSSISKRKRDATAVLKHSFDFTGFRGYSGTFDEATIREIATNPAVKYIEHDKVAKAHGLIEQKGAGWNLARISHRQPGATSYVYDESAGQGISVCLVDTGVNVRIPELGGRAIWGVNLIDREDTDGNGHGTFLASLIAGTRHGVAKKAEIIAVKVLNASGSGSTSTIIAGIYWCIQNANDRGALNSTLINLSLGGSYSRGLNQAAEAAVRAGLFVSAAVGGSNIDSGNESPASAQGVCAIAASTMDDRPALFSNYGKNVALYAPGQNIMAISNNGGTVTLSGTSFAAGHAAGVAAYLQRLEGIPGNTICNRLKQLGNPVIRNPHSGSTRLLLYNGSGR
ncbi:predicted protein [Uncinocarpus reesii 1704]|uniref:Uncharacterized protein n=1 Tax=Uncinocarpus reesii (strain UAMH 1704) TaxID=336963 RepID=C4JZD2_UNCRE|nr:uncharacterized protein UREG_07533 [Uncinocarpus reesii 1704]EEP82668.1 predicted protein [Uncinocarpus reesii 1704]